MTITAAAVVFLRAMGLFALLPFEGLLTGIAIRIALASSLVCLCAPEVSLEVMPDVSMMTGEFFIGALLAAPLLLVLQLAGGAGELLDTLRGQTIGTFYDPSSPGSQSVSAGLFRHFSWAALLCLGAFESLATMLLKSLRLLPPGAWRLEDLAALMTSLLQIVLVSLQHTMLAVLPFGICCLSIELCGALVARVSNVSFSSELFSLRTLGALCAMGLFLSADRMQSLHLFVISLERQLLP